MQVLGATEVVARVELDVAATIRRVVSLLSTETDVRELDDRRADAGRALAPTTSVEAASHGSKNLHGVR